MPDRPCKTSWDSPGWDRPQASSLGQKLHFPDHGKRAWRECQYPVPYVVHAEPVAQVGFALLTSKPCSSTEKEEKKRKEKIYSIKMQRRSIPARTATVSVRKKQS
ncbi:hypothetical protein LZ554_006267 [Drepanopeziza brunnea f. sp. 'monogermtubi']|nr:hypothetical protein LZ554_006267 [Drepanopeziza brunnea f. sp. 'monogermtubi']